MKINPLNHPACLSKPLRTVLPHSWLGHTPFAMFIVNLLKPDLFVELGTHTGVSYCAFCQAVKELGLGTRCFAIDTWEGDPHAGFYDNDVLERLRAHHDPLYGVDTEHWYDNFSILWKQEFDVVAPYFKDKCIDLLHIDGYHTYEAVKHDFETWLPKVKGVILFHDISVRTGDFGVWKLWEEIKPHYPHFEMYHCNGLGVISLNSKHKELFNMKDKDANLLRGFFARMGESILKS